MTINHVTVLIGPEPFATDTSGGPNDSFLLKTNDTALFKPAIERTLLIEDDDSHFNDTFYEIFRDRYPHLVDPTGQTLIADFDFGWPEDSSTSDILLQGTGLSWLAGQEIEDDNGNRFLAVFPVQKQEYRISDRDRDDENVLNLAKTAILGNRHAVMILPLNKLDENGNEILDENGQAVLSVFDKAAVFHNKEQFRQTSNAPGFFEYAPAPDIKCFLQGSLIQTPFGERRVETLQTGDIVVTRDNGPQPVVWIGKTFLDPDQLSRNPNKWPIVINKDALGASAPDRNLLVSPQHRILVNSRIARRMFDQDEVLVAAKHLQEIPGIYTVRPKDGVAYWHILLPQHDLVLSNGAWTESFFLGAYGLRALEPETRAALQALFPEITQTDFSPRPARRMLTGREGRRLAQRHVKNGKPLIAADRPCLQALDEEIISMA